MAYVRAKKIKRQTDQPTKYPYTTEDHYVYYQLVDGYRENGKVKQRVLAHLGAHPAPEVAIREWERKRDRWLGLAARYDEQAAEEGIPGYVARSHRIHAEYCRDEAAVYQRKIDYLRSVVTKMS